MITHQQSIRLQVLAEDLVQSAVNLRDARVKHEKATAVFADTIESLEREAKETGKFEFLIADFLSAMDDIGRYGSDKYGKDSFHHRQKSGDKSRGTLARTEPAAIAHHAAEHFQMYLRGELHDHFKTRKHQLAAVAFNAMMEFYFAGLDEE